MRTKIIIAIILLFLLCIASEFAVNGLADFPYLEKLFGPKKNVVEDDVNRYRLKPSQIFAGTSMSTIDFHTWNELRKEVDDR